MGWVHEKLKTKHIEINFNNEVGKVRSGKVRKRNTENIFRSGDRASPLCELKFKAVILLLYDRILLEHNGSQIT